MAAVRRLLGRHFTPNPNSRLQFFAKIEHLEVANSDDLANPTNLCLWLANKVLPDEWTGRWHEQSTFNRGNYQVIHEGPYTITGIISSTMFEIERDDLVVNCSHFFDQFHESRECGDCGKRWERLNLRSSNRIRTDPLR